MTVPLEFLPAELPPEAFDPARLIAQGVPAATATRAVLDMRKQRVFLSACGTYQVARTDDPSGITHLSVKRCDRAPIRDWRDMQEIKNALTHPEREACELYPAESRLVDTANQYHLWVLPAGARFPFGFTERMVQDQHEGVQLGQTQRPLAR